MSEVQKHSLLELFVNMKNISRFSFVQKRPKLTLKVIPSIFKIDALLLEHLVLVLAIYCMIEYSRIPVNILRYTCARKFQCC